MQSDIPEYSLGQFIQHYFLINNFLGYGSVNEVAFACGINFFEGECCTLVKDQLGGHTFVLVVSICGHASSEVLDVKRWATYGCNGQDDGAHEDRWTGFMDGRT